MKKIAILRKATAGPRSAHSTSSSGGAKRSFTKPVRTGGGTSSTPSFGGNRRPFNSGGRPQRPMGGRPMRSGGKKKGRGESIDINKFIFTPTKLQEEKKYTPANTFAELGLCKEVLHNLTQRGFTHPTEIQDKIIHHGIAGHDVIGLSETGSGKTAAFLLPLIEKVHKNKKQKVLIIAPTRELAQQINKELRECSHGMYLFSTVCVGGMPIYRQVEDLRRTQHFVIGTPGRLKDLVERGSIRFEEFGSIVLDEVDRMLDMGFVDDITLILKKLPKDHQTFFFSATMAPKIKALAESFSRDPKIVNLSTGIATKNVRQDVVRSTSKEDKFDKLMDLLNAQDVDKSIVFVETKREVDKLTKELNSYKYKVGLLHGDRRQRERERTLKDFKDGIINVLVATDVAARGIDVKDVSQVVNYTIPQTHDDYVHRIGRTGRAGKLGKAFTFV
jgi:superfamily II DNA/RNA helicase